MTEVSHLSPKIYYISTYTMVLMNMLWKVSITHGSDSLYTNYQSGAKNTQNPFVQTLIWYKKTWIYANLER